MVLGWCQNLHTTVVRTGRLQSMRAVGRHLSQYPSAVDAFAAPGTCKQLTHQIIVVWEVYGGADNSPAQLALAHAAAAMSSTPINAVSKRASGGGDSPAPSSPIGL